MRRPVSLLLLPGRFHGGCPRDLLRLRRIRRRRLAFSRSGSGSRPRAPIDRKRRRRRRSSPSRPLARPVEEASRVRVSRRGLAPAPDDARLRRVSGGVQKRGEVPIASLLRARLPRRLRRSVAG